MKTGTRAHARMIWLLDRMTRRGFGNEGFIVAWGTDTVDAFVKAFPEAEKTLKTYTLGPNSSPMLNAAAKRAKDAGYITPGHIGNQDARLYNQRTWCRTWRITGMGRDALAFTKDKADAHT